MAMKNQRLWIFRVLAAVLFPALVLGVFEAGLRYSGSGYSTDFIAKTVADGVTVYHENKKFSWQYFPAIVARQPLFFSFPAEKTERTYRIFVMGASAAQGDPEPTYGFSRILERMLAYRYPDIHFEVINTGVTAINSHVVYQIAQDIAPLEGDLFIVYLGNNEVVGPFGAGTVFAPLSPSLPLIRLGILARSSRLGQSLVSASNLLQPEEEKLTKWRGMEMFLDQQVRADDPGMEKVYRYFEANLEDILSVAHRAETKVILSTVGTNLADFAPLASQHRHPFPEEEKVKWDELFRNGMAHMKAGRCGEANLQFLEAEKIDESHAALQFLLGRCAVELANYSEAKRRYRLARDLDTLRFRADSRLNEIIRDVGTGRTREGVFLVDAARELEAESDHGIPGNELLYEHVHMTFKGNYLIAKSLFTQVEKIIPPALKLPMESESRLLTLEESMQELAYSGFDQHRIAEDILQRLKRPPFTNQLNHEEGIGLAQRQEEELRVFMTPDALLAAGRQYERALQRKPEDPWLHFNFARLNYASGNFEAAAHQFERLLGLLPHHYEARERLGASLIQIGRFDAAVEQCREVLRVDPNFHAARYTMAFAFSKMGKLDEAIAIYEELLLVDPNVEPVTYNELGRMYVQEARYAEAIGALKEGIRIDIDAGGESNPDMHYNLGVALKRNGQTEAGMQALSEAALGYLEILEGRQGSAALYFALGSVYVERREFQNAAQYFRKAMVAKPSDFRAHMNLAKSLEAQGRLDEAIEALQASVDTMRQLGQQDSVRALQRYQSALFLKNN